MDLSYIEQIKPNSFIEARDILYSGTLRRIKQSKTPYQAIWEAVTNSFESIRESKEDLNHFVELRFYYSSLYDNFPVFDHVEIEDTGVGFNDVNFDRFLRVNDDSKGFQNRGSGRIQLLHEFQESEYTSVYSEDGKYKLRIFVCSANKSFLDHNAIVLYKGTNETSESQSHTVLSCRGLINKNSSDYSFENINAEKFRNILKEHYLPFFCSFRTNIPSIRIIFYNNEKIDSEAYINPEDLPSEDKDFFVTIKYSEYDREKKCIIKLQDTETFRMRCFQINEESLSRNRISIVCKGEVISEKIELSSLKETDSIDGKRFLVFISGDYFDKRIGDTRGDIFLLKEKDIKQDDLLFNEKTIILEDIEKTANLELRNHFPSITRKEKEYQDNISELQRMFLLDEDAVRRLSLKLGINTTPQVFLKNAYEIDSEKAAKVDSELKGHIDSLNRLNPTDSDYQDQFNSIISSAVKAIPLQNRTDLTRYVARRKLVLELFDKALNCQLEMQKDPDAKNINEKILHNILFQQTSTNPEDSDLWLINEDFIYFKGTSDMRLSDIMISGESFFRKDLSEEERAYLQSFGENRKLKRPDVLLFPEEGKCIIIEFKNPDVNVSEHLDQINKYASLILQFSSDKFITDTFFGYLIGENFSARDVRAADGNFRFSYQFDYLFRPSQTIAGENRPDGALYTEVIKYSTLLKRAKTRNEMFIKKITQKRI
jgi:hypothetical protein